MRWESRYSSGEMLHIEVTSMEVRCFLDHSEDQAEWWTFEEVLTGEWDSFIESLFGMEAVSEIKEAVWLRHRAG